MPSFKRFSALLLGLLGLGRLGHAQSLTPTSVELDIDTRAHIAAVGPSGVSLHSTALRVVTGLGPGLRFVAYGTHQYGASSLQQSLVEKDWGANRLQVGLVRLPFGIYDVRETYATGLIDYPMPRGDYAYNSVDWGVPGVEWAANTDRLQIEAAVFGGRSQGIWDTEHTVRGGAARVQAYTNDLIVGVSRWDGALEVLPGSHQIAPTHITGLDARYTRPHLLLRGEYIVGELGGDHEWGWYTDAYYHLPGLAKWTATGRLEALKPEATAGTGRQTTLGLRYVASPEWTLVANWRRNAIVGKYQPSWAANAGKDTGVFLQVYRKFNQ